MNSKRGKIFKILLLTLTLVFTFSVTSSAAGLNKKKVTIFAGKTQTLKVKGVSGKVKWSSTKPSVVKVSSNGKISALKKGTAKINAVVNKKTYTCSVTVKQPVQGVGLNKTRYYLANKKTVKLVCAVSPKTANDKRITWSSSNKKIAKVNSSGLVTAVGKGTATITAKAKDGSGKKATCKIIVFEINNSASNTENTTPVSDNKPAVTPDISSGGTSAAGSSITKPSSTAQNFLKHLAEYSKIAQADAAAGTPWEYQNSKESKTFAEAVKNGNRRTNCALLPVWALKESDVGVYEYKDKFWGESYGKIHYGGSDPAKSEAHLKAKTDIIPINALPSEAYAQGKLIPGDICIYNMGATGHTNVYAGYNSKTDKFLWYDTGHNNIGGAYKNGIYYFNSFGPIESKYNNTIAWVIRLK